MLSAGTETTMTDVIQNSLPTPEDVKQAVDAAFAVEGYIKDNGTRDMVQVRRTIIDVLMADEVANARERRVKPVTRGDLVSRVFPSVAGPESFDEAENPVLARDLWDKLSGLLWAQTSVNGPLQTEIESYSGDGHFVCQTRKGKDKTPAAYMTTDFQLIDEDVIRKLNKSVRAKMETAVRVRERIIRRRPQDAARVAKMGKDEFKSVAESNTQRLMLAAAQARAASEAADEAPEPDTTGSES